MVREPVFWLEATDPLEADAAAAAAAVFGECVPPARTSAPRRRWRLGLAVSAGAHVLLAGLLYIGVGKLVALPVVTGPALDRGIAEYVEEEQDYLVMDVGVAAAPATPTPTRSQPVIPTVEPPTVSTTPSVASPVAMSNQGSGGAAGDPLAPSPEGSSGPRAASSAGIATTAFFQVATQARSVVYVIDRSGSMGNAGRLALARRELQASLERLPETARFQVIPYNRRAEPLRINGQSGLVTASAENKRAALALVDNLIPEGSTEHQAALQQALLLHPEAIYFLTDADDLLPDQVRALTRLNQGRASIHAIELTAAHRAAHAMPLHVLARDNHGEYRGVDVQ